MQYQLFFSLYLSLLVAWRVAFRETRSFAIILAHVFAKSSTRLEGGYYKPMIAIKPAQRMLMSVNAGTTRADRKPSRCFPTMKAKEGGRKWSLLLFSSGRETSGWRGKRDGTQWPTTFFFVSFFSPWKMWCCFSLRLTCSYLWVARIVWPGRAIEAHSSAIACTLFFITAPVPLYLVFRLQFQGSDIAVDLRVFWDNWSEILPLIFFFFFWR